MDDLIELARFIRQALDEHEQRLCALEDRQSPWRASLSAGVQQRRAVVARLRQSGLSITQIAIAIDAARATVERDLAAVEHCVPAYVLGRDGKRHPAHKLNGQIEP